MSTDPISSVGPLVSFWSLLNGWGVLCAIVAAMAIGALWYGPLFGKRWEAATGRTPEDGTGYGVPFMLVVALGLAAFTMGIGALVDLVSILAQGASYRLEVPPADVRLLGIAAICMPVAALFCAFIGMMHGFAGRPFSLWLIDAGYVFVAMALLVVLAGLWGGTPDATGFINPSVR